MPKPKITISIELVPGPVEMYSIVSKVDGFPATELHDDWFPKEVAKTVARELKEEVQEQNPDKTVILEL